MKELVLVPGVEKALLAAPVQSLPPDADAGAVRSLLSQL
eukprot:gene30095-56085_t